MSAPDDTPLYVLCINDEWYELELEAWEDIALMSDDPEGDDYD